MSDGIAIGVMGGTFNPIHYGHLVAAETAREAFNLSRVIFVPSGRPPHKPGTVVAPAEHRYLMTFLATASHERFDTSRIELDRPGPSYTSDTLEALNAVYPGARWYFITGADAVMEMPTWHHVERIFARADVIAASRPGYTLRRAELEARLGPLTRRIYDLQVPALAISSSEVRARLAQGLSIRYLVPDAVAHYIYKNRLYGTGSSGARNC
jgi:nicotinate-nucleotide adenylyltransferase